MASRSKKKKPVNLQKQDIQVQKQIDSLEKTKKSLDSRLSGIVALALLVLLVLILCVPVVEVSMTIDLKSIAEQIAQETGEPAAEVQNETINIKLTALELMMAPSQSKGNAVEYLANKSQIAKNEQGQKLVLQVVNGILTTKEKDSLNVASIFLVVASYAMAAFIVISMIVAIIERNLKKQRYLFTLILSGILSVICLVQFIFEIVMLIMATKNASVSIAWGLFILMVASFALFAYMIYHHIQYKKLKQKEITNENMS